MRAQWIAVTGKWGAWAGMALLTLSLGLFHQAEAATRFVATTGTDAGNACLVAGSPCKTITHALTQAVANDTISVAAGTYGLALGETFPITINANLTLTGAESGATVIDATGANNRVIRVHAATVTIGGVSITGGALSCTNCDLVGAGLFNDGGVLTLTNSTVSGNTASCEASENGRCSASGAGLFNTGDLIVTNSAITQNTARCTKRGVGSGCEALGGGLANEGSSTLTNSTVSGNTSTCTINTDGFCGGHGGGIANDGGTVTLTNGTVSENTASCTNNGNGNPDGCESRGGGIYNTSGSTTKVTNSTVSGNTGSCLSSSPGSSCFVDGGGLNNGGSFSITNSTVSGNTATCMNSVGTGCGASGGGIANKRPNDVAGTTLNVANSTVSGNTASCPSGVGTFCQVAGGGVFNLGALALASSTLTGNIVSCSLAGCTPIGGGIRNDPSLLSPTLLNTIVANSPQGGNCSGSITSLGHNLSSDLSCAFGGPGDLNATNPLLGLLQENGGPTKTHALISGSPAIDAGSNTGCPATDQRGFLRPVNGNLGPLVTCDMGAFELNTVATTLVGAVLPTERTAQGPTPGPASTVTAFATILNTGGATAQGCAIAPFTPVAANFLYQTTNAQNQLTGAPNTPANIPAGQGQSFLFAFTPTATFARTEVQLSFACANSSPAPIISGVNPFLLRATAQPAPDIVALAATAPNDGIVRLASVGAFAVAAVNVGAPGLLTVSANTGTASLALTITLCETNPQNGQCLVAPAPTVQTQINTSATPTFSVFVSATAAVPFNPATNRIQVRFDGAGGGGGTSVAVCTAPLCP